VLRNTLHLLFFESFGIHMKNTRGFKG
jgi:hypothetical protein